MGRQLIQELRLKHEKKSLQTKEKKVEMQGESAGEHARGKGAKSWQQTQQRKYKAAATQVSKQVNPDGRGAPMPSTLPWLQPIYTGVGVGDAEEATAQSPDALKEWAVRRAGPQEGDPGSHKEPSVLQRTPPSRQRGRSLVCPCLHQ